ncbi:hypothetical protein SAMD00019534_006750, partial [Acytostelium subglobosum LB1]|uniref:hypothetical protein n=1 Tax=Acytostelium subglobosum LB1 TaxID=1410327 RepID=UPI000644DFF1
LASVHASMDGWVQSLESTSVTTTTTTTSTTATKSKIKTTELLAVDCEMCRTVNGLELTRISIVNEHRKVVLDQYVKPKNEILDFLTQYSGITEATLKKVTTTLQDVQAQLVGIISKSTVLVGHSLENDLKAMRFVHERVIDTSVIFPTGSSAKYPLRYLAQKYLRRTIQSGKGGHSSIEDAVAVLDLVKLKITKGKNFGTKLENYKNLFNHLQVHLGKRSTFIDTTDQINQYSTTEVTSVQCASDDDVAKNAAEQVGSESNNKTNFVCLRLSQLDQHFKSLDTTIPKPLSSYTPTIEYEDGDCDVADGVATPTTTTTTTISTSTSTTSTSSTTTTAKGIVLDQKVLDIFKNIDDQLNRIYDRMTKNSMMMVVFGPGPFNDINLYHHDGNRQREYLLALEMSKEGLVKFGIK